MHTSTPGCTPDDSPDQAQPHPYAIRPTRQQSVKRERLHFSTTAVVALDSLTPLHQNTHHAKYPPPPPSTYAPDTHQSKGPGASFSHQQVCRYALPVLHHEQVPDLHVSPFHPPEGRALEVQSPRRGSVRLCVGTMSRHVLSFFFSWFALREGGRDGLKRGPALRSEEPPKHVANRHSKMLLPGDTASTSRRKTRLHTEW